MSDIKGLRVNASSLAQPMHFTLIEAGTQEAGDIRSELESLGKEKVMKRLTAVTMLAGSFVVAALLIPTTAEAAHGNNGRNNNTRTKPNTSFIFQKEALA